MPIVPRPAFSDEEKVRLLIQIREVARLRNPALSVLSAEEAREKVKQVKVYIEKTKDDPWPMSSDDPFDP